MLNIAVLAYDNCLQSGIAGMLDLFTLAKWEQKRLTPDSNSLFCHTEVITVDGEAATSFNRQQVMAKRAGLNERTFLRRFRKATGEAPLEYLQKMRIEKAKQLLIETDQSLESITSTVGYVDLSSFRRLFRQIVGIPPTNYQQRFGE
ncbi:MAG: helix-turn-helix domain-containing protein [Desulfuromusa sp.]|nr:helix-turn-helix domain-containing protein [Desulfuromusa sp.]